MFNLMDRAVWGRGDDRHMVIVVGRVIHDPPYYDIALSPDNWCAANIRSNVRASELRPVEEPTLVEMAEEGA